jgi:RNA polymerase sigma factor (sigma-70 family)
MAAIVRTLYTTDDVLIEGIKLDRNDALEVLYKRFYATVLHLVISNNGSEHDAKDLYQETVLIVYEKFRYGNTELTCSLKTFIYSIARNLWLKKLKEKGSGNVSITDNESFLNLTDEMENADNNEKLHEQISVALNNLGEPCRSLIEDFYLKGLNMSSITEKYAYSNSDTAKTQKYKCLMRLKKMFFNTTNEDKED